MSCGFRRTEAIMNDASQSSRIPFWLKDAAMGIVPYMYRGDAMPNMHAGIIPNMLKRLLLMEAKSPCILALPKTETNEPIAIPASQYT